MKHLTSCVCPMCKHARFLAHCAALQRAQQAAYPSAEYWEGLRADHRDGGPADLRSALLAAESALMRGTLDAMFRAGPAVALRPEGTGVRISIKGGREYDTGR